MVRFHSWNLKVTKFTLPPADTTWFNSISISYIFHFYTKRKRLSFYVSSPFGVFITYQFRKYLEKAKIILQILRIFNNLSRTFMNLSLIFSNSSRTTKAFKRIKWFYNPKLFNICIWISLKAKIWRT